MSRFTLFLSSFIIGLVIAAATPSPELYSQLISSKIRTIAQNEPSPATYPQYTDSTGKWQYFSPNTWTSGFFPAMLYALNTRAKLCNTGDGDTWVALGRQWSAGEIPLETKNSVGHDVGFLSMPFVEEYYM
jgi:hypothetical protein